MIPSHKNNIGRSGPSLSRRDFVLRTTACGAAVLSARHLIPESLGAEARSQTPLRSESCAPVVYWTGEQEATLSWPVAGPSQGWVEYGPTPKLGKKTVAGEGIADFVGGFTPLAMQNGTADRPEPICDVLRVRLKELTPGQCVYFRGHWRRLDGTGPTVAGKVRKLILPDPKAKRAAIAIWNDTQDNHDTLRALHKLTAKEPTDLLVWNGDVSNNIEREQQIVPLYLAPAQGLDITPRFPLVFARGNHDVRGRMAFRLGH
jgi:acid phosphatase type 7